MRIIAGQFRRRKLLAKPGLTTRPMTDFVKETLFSRIEDRLAGRRVADAFAGTGTIGLEALSRGATSVVFFEKDPRAFELLKRNVAKLEVEPTCFCWKTDLFRCSFSPKGDEARFLPFDWIFFDPPFAKVEKCQPGSEFFRVLQRFAREEISSPDVRLVFRTPTRTDFKMPSAWEVEDHCRSRTCTCSSIGSERSRTTSRMTASPRRFNRRPTKEPVRRPRTLRTADMIWRSSHESA